MIKFLRNSHWCQLALLVILVLGMVTALDAKTIESVIPSDSFLYLKLQNLEECRHAIETSDNWKTAADIITASPKWSHVSQFIQTLPLFLGSDIQGFIETYLGDKIAITVSPGSEGLLIGVVVEDEIKTRQVEQLIAKIVQTLASTKGNHVQLDESEYKNIKYRTAQINEQKFEYGIVDGTLLLVGITPGSFEKMVDVYKRKEKSIIANPEYQSADEEFGEGEVFAFINVEEARPFMNAILPSTLSKGLENFRTLVLSWEVLQKGGSQHVYGRLKTDSPRSPIQPGQEKEMLPTTQALSGKEGFFLTATSSTANTIWQMIGSDSADDDSGAIRTEPSVSEGLSGLLMPPQMDLREAIAGEIAISGNFSSFRLLQHNTLGINLDFPDGVVEFGFPAVDFGVIFNPDSPEKWEVFLTTLLENLTIHSRHQFDYKGFTFNTVSIPGTIYYGNVNELFVLCFSEGHLKSVVDNVLTGNGTFPFAKRFEGSAGHITFLAEVNLDDYLSLIATEEEWELFPKKIGDLQVSVREWEEAAWMDIKISPERRGIDAVALLAPAILLEILEIPFPQ